MWSRCKTSRITPVRVHEERQRTKESILSTKKQKRATYIISSRISFMKERMKKAFESPLIQHWMFYIYESRINALSCLFVVIVRCLLCRYYNKLSNSTQNSLQFEFGYVVCGSASSVIFSEFQVPWCKFFISLSFPKICSPPWLVPAVSIWYMLANLFPARANGCFEFANFFFLVFFFLRPTWNDCI